MASLLETAAMRSAIALSVHGVGTTSPNPPVGCVILDSSHQVVGQGYHRRKGEPHAETLALEEAGAQAHRGTAVVTLEPCNHQGRTPACHAALIEAGISRVVVALVDPTSRNEGGIARLQAAGVDVEVGLLAAEAELVLGPWLRTLHTGRPILWWIPTSGPVQPDGHPLSRLRSRSDAIIHANGCITESVPNSHGVGTLDLPETHLPHKPDVTVHALFEGGARTVLLEANRDLAKPFLHHGFIDHVAVVLTEGISTPPMGTEVGVVPDGFVLDRVVKEGTVVVIEATRQELHVSSQRPSLRTDRS